MHYLRLALVLVGLSVWAGQAPAQQLPLSDLSGYLNSFETAEAEFTQINPDGTISTGRLFIKRPGRIRFEYNPPEKALVVAGGGQVAVFDPLSSSGVDRYPLTETPLKIILERNVDLSRANMVTGHRADGPKTIVTAQDPENPDYGNIQLVFTGGPTELRQWIVTDQTGSQTTVILGDLTTGGRVRDILFNIGREMRQRGLDE